MLNLLSMKLLPPSVFCAVACVLSLRAASGAIIFDDFNLNEGHFNLHPGYAGQSTGEDPSSTADRVLTTSIEGDASQLLHLVHDATTDALRIRHLSGGGTVANNVPFTITDGEDGFIGFYAKTTASGWQVSLNLDGSGGGGADMDGSSSVPLIGDGQWHLYEWDLDAAVWGSVPSIGGGHGGFLLNGSHTIDSIYFRDLDGTPGPTADIYIDFVAKSDSGSIAAMIPEPSAFSAGLLGGGLLLGRSMRRRK